MQTIKEQTDSIRKSNEELLTIRELSTILKVKPGTVYAKVARREIPYIKIGPLVRFRAAAVEAYLAEHAVAPIA